MKRDGCRPLKYSVVEIFDCASDRSNHTVRDDAALTQIGRHTLDVFKSMRYYAPAPIGRRY